MVLIGAGQCLRESLSSCGTTPSPAIAQPQVRGQYLGERQRYSQLFFLFFTFISHLLGLGKQAYRPALHNRGRHHVTSDDFIGEPERFRLLLVSPFR